MFLHQNFNLTNVILLMKVDGIIEADKFHQFLTCSLIHWLDGFVLNFFKVLSFCHIHLSPLFDVSCVESGNYR